MSFVVSLCRRGSILLHLTGGAMADESIAPSPGGPHFGHFVGQGFPWVLAGGGGGQYILGPGLQPSVSGVLLLAGIHAFLTGRPWLAITCAALASDLHSTYLPTSAFFTIAFMTA